MARRYQRMLSHVLRRLPETFAAALSAACTLLLLAGPAAAKSHPLETAIAESAAFSTANMGSAFARIRGTGASTARIFLSWRSVAPTGYHATEPTRKPADFDAADPADPAYDWSYLDRLVVTAHRNNLEPLISINDAPEWAEGPASYPAPRTGTRHPNPDEFGQFATAAALRYSGRFGGLPRVRYWQAWNEPNLARFLWPQYDTPNEEPVRPGDRLLSPDIYRRLVNVFADAVHSVHDDNLVIAGGLGPFGNERAYMHIARPMTFMRRLLCMNDRNRPKPGCTERIRFDVWSVHPYTSGGPTHSALSPLDVSLGDLDEVRRVLNRAVRAGQVISKRRPLFWVTEFGWDTKRPDPEGVPTKLHRRWVADALYRMWKNGVSLVTWFLIQDVPRKSFGWWSHESGFYFHCDGGLTCAKRKPSLQAFRFPFVAFRSGASVRVWGRTPFGLPGRVTIEQRRSGRWRRVAVLRADRYGIFRKRLRTRGRGVMRARLSGDRKHAGVRRREGSAPFSLKPVPDRHFDPFGAYGPTGAPETEPESKRR